MFQYIQMLFGLANAGNVYSRMLDVAMKEVDGDFWTSYLDDILTFSMKALGPGSPGTCGRWNQDSTL